MNPFRFGHTAFPTMATRGEWAETARRAQAAGCSVLTVTDHFGTSGGIWSALLAAHQAAPGLRVGTLMLNNDLWNPAVLAREAITTDVLTDGALELGLGAGWSESDYRAAGVAHDAPGVRIDRLREALAILELAFAGRPVSFRGTHYAMESEQPWPAARQQPIPLVIGGGGRRMLELAARHARTVSIHRNLEQGTGRSSWRGADGTSAPLAKQVSERIGWVRAAAGERFSSLELHALVMRVLVTDSRESAAADLAAPLGLEPADILASPHFLVGTVDQLADDLRERRERWGISYWTITRAADLGPLAPVIARLAGR